MKDNRKIYQDINKLGYPLLEIEETLDANKILAEVVETKDIRLWEGFPLLLANSYKRGLFSYDNVYSYLKIFKDKSNFKTLILLSFSLYRFLDLELVSIKKLSSEDKKKIDIFLKGFKKNSEFIIEDMRLDSKRIRKIFENYFKKQVSNMGGLLSKQEELSLEYAMSQVFSPKQKEIFLKKLKGEKLSKTEREYFSRAIKKKILALANSELHRLAQRLLNF